MKDIHNDKYPQFNESRNVKDLKRDYIPDAKALLAGEYEGLTLTAEQAEKLTKLVADAEAMMDRTINNRVEDDKIITALHDYMVEIGRYDAPSEPTTADKALDFILGGINDIVYALVGPRGFSDVFNEFLGNLKAE